MNLKNYVIIVSLVSGFALLLTSPIDVYGITILVTHGGSGDLELCAESEGYEEQCDDFDLSEYQNPFEYILDVENPDEGHNFRICYELRDTEIEDCRNFEFTGSSQQTVDVEIPSTGLPTEEGNTNNNDFSLPSNGGDSLPSSDTGLPDLPPLPALPP